MGYEFWEQLIFGKYRVPRTSRCRSGDRAAHPPANFVKAIAQYPDRVPTAIQYLQDQQQRHSIQNPVGYLYEAVSQRWAVSPRSSQ